MLADGRLASGGDDGQIKLWPRDGVGEPVVLTHGGRVQSLAVLADGRLASGGDDGQIKLWPRDGEGEPVVLTHGSGFTLPGGAGGRAAGQRRRGRPDQALAARRLWASPRDPVMLTHGSGFWSLAVLADGRLASGGGDGQIKLWPRGRQGEPVVLSARRTRSISR